MARPDRVGAAETRELIGDWLDAPGYDAANAEMRSQVFGRPEVVRVPVTVAWGEHDRLVRPPRPERMPAGTRFVVLRGCGHTPTWDDPEQVAAVILATSARGGAVERPPHLASSGHPTEERA